MMKASGSEVAPPLCTVTCAVPAEATRLAGTCAVSCRALTNVVVRFCPFQRTVAPEANAVTPTACASAAAVACTFSTFSSLPPATETVRRVGCTGGTLGNGTPA